MTSTAADYITFKLFRHTHRQLKIVAAVRGETLAQVVDALVQRELARLRADGRLRETLDGVEHVGVGAGADAERTDGTARAHRDGKGAHGA